MPAPVGEVAKHGPSPCWVVALTGPATGLILDQPTREVGLPPGSPGKPPGRHLHVERGALGRQPDPVSAPYFAGSSSAAIDVAARHADVYLTWGEPPDQVAEKVERVRAAARSHGRAMRFGIRLHVVSRDRSARA